MSSHETPTYRAGRRETVLVIVGAGQGLGVRPISTWSVRTGGSGFPDVLGWGWGRGLDVDVPAWGRGARIKGFPEPKAILLNLPNQTIKPVR